MPKGIFKVHELADNGNRVESYAVTVKTEEGGHFVRSYVHLREAQPACLRAVSRGEAFSVTRLRAEILRIIISISRVE